MNYLEKNSNYNKIAFVVGGLGAIGFEVSKALSDSGAKVVIIDIKDKDKKIKSLLKKNEFEYYKINFLSDKNFHKDLNKIFKDEKIKKNWFNYSIRVHIWLTRTGYELV